MIVLCVLHSSGRVERHKYPATAPGSAIETALRVGQTAISDLKLKCWIEHENYPASKPTLEKAQRWKLRDPFSGGRSVH
jgi:hypothetical protein